MNIEKILEETIKNLINRALLTQEESKMLQNTYIGLSIIYAGKLIAEAIENLKDKVPIDGL